MDVWNYIYRFYLPKSNTLGMSLECRIHGICIEFSTKKHAAHFHSQFTCINDSHFLLLLTVTAISLKGVRKLNHRVQCNKELQCSLLLFLSYWKNLILYCGLINWKPDHIQFTKSCWIPEIWNICTLPISKWIIGHEAYKIHAAWNPRFVNHHHFRELQALIQAYWKIGTWNLSIELLRGVTSSSIIPLAFSLASGSPVISTVVSLSPSWERCTWNE